MTTSKTAIGRRIPRKMDPYIVETVFAAKKHAPWMSIAQIVSGSRRQYAAVNISQLQSQEEGSIIVIPGKVLGNGDLTKRLRICAIYFSASALNKIKHANGEAVRLVDEISKNPKAQGVKIIK